MILVALFLACDRGPDPAGDAQSYGAALRAASSDPEEALLICDTVRDPNLRGDCALAVASANVQRFRAQPEAVCAAVPEGTWRDECLFQAAELELRRRNPERAAALCLAATAFRDECGMHLWMGELEALTFQMGPVDFAARLPAAQDLFTRWQVALAGTDLETRLWRMFYQQGFGARGDLDLRVCDALDAPHGDRCAETGANRVVDQIVTTLRSGGLMPRFCAIDGPTAEGVGVGQLVGAMPHPAITTQLQARQAMICEGWR